MTRPPYVARKCPAAAFTIVELLVVVTIIVVLLALLAPAMDQAVYQAQLAICSAQQRTVGQCAINYALDHKRTYPYRPAVDNVDSNWQAISLYHKPGAWGPYDDRPTLRPYMDINKLLNDPLVAKVVLDRDWDRSTPDSSDGTADVVASVSMWFGYRYDRNVGMHKIGDRWTFGGKSFDVLVCDRDVVGGAGNALGQVGVQCSHPDKDGVMYNVPVQDGQHPWGGANLNLTISMWLNLVSAPRRGTVDTNYTYQDLSVHRFIDVINRKPGSSPPEPDERMTTVRTFVNTQGGPQNIPKN